jgi:2-polyprenyl-3-methyl-5-hydroxy-6-metoxy-1,4-benzoquinol methylase
MTTYLTSDGFQAQERWNDRYRQSRGTPAPAQILRDFAHLLPYAGDALDLACGMGANALFLAARGLHTWAWDVSDVAITHVRCTAKQRMVAVHAEVRDVVAAPPEPGSFDVIVISRFLERSLAPKLVAALRPDGLLLYQTFTILANDDYGPHNTAYRLAPQELLQMFHQLRVIVYREEGQLGDVTQGLRNEVMFVGQKLTNSIQGRCKR